MDIKKKTSIVVIALIFIALNASPLLAGLHPLFLKNYRSSEHSAAVNALVIIGLIVLFVGTIGRIVGGIGKKGKTDSSIPNNQRKEKNKRTIKRKKHSDSNPDKTDSDKASEK